MLGRQEHASEVGVERSLPDVEVEPVRAVVLADELQGRVRDDDVEAAELPDGRTDGPGDDAFVRDVASQVECTGDGLAAQIEHGDPGALCQEALGRRPPDAAAAARDERPLAL